MHTGFPHELADNYYAAVDVDTILVHYEPPVDAP